MIINIAALQHESNLGSMAKMTAWRRGGVAQLA